MRQVLARAAAVSALIAALSPAAADALIAEGAPAPAFTKNQLAGGPGSWSKGSEVSLADYPTQVVVLFLLGYD